MPKAGGPQGVATAATSNQAADNWERGSFTLREMTQAPRH